MKYLLAALLLLAPALAYAGNGSYVVRQKVVEFAHPLGISVVGVPVTSLGLRYYYQIRTEISEDEVNRISERVLENLEVLDGENIIEGETETAPETEDAPVTVDGPELQKDVEKVILTKCGACHKADSDSGYELVRDGKLNPELTTTEWWNIFDRVDGSHLPKKKIMPKNGDPLPQEEVDLIRFYVRSLEK